ncbi:MAG: multidrug effflux MFS transporter [Cocleimonas sp.]
MNSKPVSMWKLTLLVSLLSMIGPFTIDTYLPAFESMEQDFTVTRALMTQTLGSYLMAFAISTIIWGAISDWIGRKPVILMALGSYCLASIACAMATSYEQFVLFRILQGLGIGGSLISGRAMVRDVLDTKDAQKVMAQAMMLFAISPAIAPIIGGWLHEAFGWRSIFWFLSFYAVSVLLFALLATQESLPKNKRNSIHIQKVSRVYLRTLSNPHYLRLVFILACAFSSFFLYVAGAPTLLFDVLGLASTDFYILFIPVVSGIFIGAIISSRLIDRYTGRQIINFFLSMMLIVAIINMIIAHTVEPSLFSTLIPLILYSISLATIMPILTIRIIDCFPNNRGTASAMQSFIHMGFNGLSVSFIVALLGASVVNFAHAQLALVSIAFILLIVDNRLAKA